MIKPIILSIFLLSSLMTLAIDDNVLTLGFDSRTPLSRSDMLSNSIGYLKIFSKKSSRMLDKNTQEHVSLSGECTASIINEKFLLTAAHCIVEDGSVINSANLKFYPSLNMNNNYFTSSIAVPTVGGQEYPFVINELVVDASVEPFVPKEYLDFKNKCKGDYVALADYETCKDGEFKYDIALVKLRDKVTSPYISLKMEVPSLIEKTGYASATGYPADLKETKNLPMARYVEGVRTIDHGDVISNPAYRGTGEYTFSKKFKRLASKDMDLAQGMSGGPWINSRGNIIGVSSLMVRIIKSDKTVEGASFNEAAALDSEIQTRLKNWMAINKY